MKNLKLLLIFLLIISCTVTTEVVTELTTTSTSSATTSSSTTTTISEDPLIVKTFEELPNALVRIQVKSTQAELTEDLEIEIFEYEGSGSGFFISSDGYIVTNNHVISGAVTIEVFTQYRSQPYTAKLIGLSECDDLAVIKIDIDDAQYLVFENSEPKLGQDILAAGFPLGDEEVTFLNGIVSKKQTNGSTSWASIEYAFEHTAEILPGSSGGPIVNDDVKVLGIAYAGNEDRQEFGIPIVVVENKIQQIINDEFQYSFKANVEQFYGGGLYIYSVDSDSPFREVGIKGGELITQIKGLSLAEETTLKVYCDAIFARDPDIGINFVGVSIEELEEFEVEVSLLGNIVEVISRESIFASSQKTTNTTNAPVSTTTTTLSTVKEPKYKYDLPFITKIDTFLISEHKWQIKIYLNYKNTYGDNENDGLENIQHCSINLIAPPYWGSKVDPATKFGQTKREKNCTSERINDSQVLITHTFEVDPNYFSWSSLEKKEIPIASIELYPEYDPEFSNAYNFSMDINFGRRGDCGGSESWEYVNGEYFSPDCSDVLDQISTNRNGRYPIKSPWVYFAGNSTFDWVDNQNITNQYVIGDYGRLFISQIDSNNYCSSSHISYAMKRYWYIYNPAICIKR